MNILNTTELYVYLNMDKTVNFMPSIFYKNKQKSMSQIYVDLFLNSVVVSMSCVFIPLPNTTLPLVQ